MYHLPVRSGLSNNDIATLSKRFVYRRHVNVSMLNADLEIYSFIERCTYRETSGSVCHKICVRTDIRIQNVRCHCTYWIMLGATVPQHLLGNEISVLYHPLKKVQKPAVWDILDVRAKGLLNTFRLCYYFSCCSTAGKREKDRQFR